MGFPPLQEPPYVDVDVEFENAALRFSVEGKHFENEAFGKRCHHTNVIS